MRLLRSGAGLDWRSTLGELGLIVVGVLLALAANSWWESRSERRSERAYLRQLQADVRETERNLNSAIAVDSANLASVQRFVGRANAFLESGGAHVPPRDSLDLVTAYSSFAPVSGTYTALLAGGGAQLLRSDTLRLRIIAFAATIAAAQEVLRHTEAQTWRNSEALNRGVWSNVLQPATGRRWREDIEVATLFQDPELLTAMTMQAQVGQNRLAVLRGLRAPVADLGRMLEDELGRR